MPDAKPDKPKRKAKDRPIGAKLPEGHRHRFGRLKVMGKVKGWDTPHAPGLAPTTTWRQPADADGRGR